MAKVCSVCGKGKVSGNQVSHSNRHSRRTWSANLRSVRAIIDGTPKRVKVCTRCLRSGKIELFMNLKTILESHFGNFIVTIFIKYSPLLF